MCSIADEYQKVMLYIDKNVDLFYVNRRLNVVYHRFDTVFDITEHTVETLFNDEHTFK